MITRADRTFIATDDVTQRHDWKGVGLIELQGLSSVGVTGIWPELPDRALSTRSSSAVEELPSKCGVYVESLFALSSNRLVF